ncbi:Hint domain-containing protein [Amylibacter sp.]|nr:Hint domain-containing protein [Amylibacter sp.]
MTQFTFFEINGDPLTSNQLTAGASGTAVVIDDDGDLQPNTTDFDPQFTIDGVPFSGSAYPDYSSTGSSVEVYAANIPGGGQITFFYLTAANDGVDDGVDRIVLLSGTMNPGDRIVAMRLTEGDLDIPYQDIPSIICFTPGSLITTPRGQVPVELLMVGDLVITADNGLQAIRWIGKKRMTGARLQAYPELRPIRIRKDAFGDGLPERDMWVSPQHRMLVKSERTLLDYGENEVLVPAKGLLNDLSVTVDYGLRETEYVHILFDKHEVVFANSTPTESFHPGQHALDTIEDEARDELFEIFPELASDPMEYGPSARLSLKVREVQSLTKRGLIGVNPGRM